MDFRDILDAARRTRYESTRTMDTLGTGGQGAEQARRTIIESALAAGFHSHTVEGAADDYVKALRRVQDLNEQLHEATGGLIDAASSVNHRLTQRGIPAVF